MDYFADSSFWIALVDKRDNYHRVALECSSKLSGRLITTQAVLLETANAFARPAWRDKVVGLIDHIASRPDIESVQLSESLWNRAWRLFRERGDKSWSLTDCISFEVMQERGLDTSLTADSHFRQAGFRALLLDE